VGFGAALRRSEFVALTVSDIHFEARGLRIVVRHSKTDQEAASAEIGIISQPAVDAVREADITAIYEVPPSVVGQLCNRGGRCGAEQESGKRRGPTAATILLK
jgi:integrase